MHDNRLHDGNIPKDAGGKFDWELVRADLASAAFGKNAFVYGHIDEKRWFVRKNSDVSDPVLRTNAPESGFCP